MLMGDPGTGISALLEVAAEAATARGIRIVRCLGPRGRAEPRFPVVTQLLRLLAEEIGTLAPTHRRVLERSLELGRVRTGDELEVSTALLILLQGLTVDRPLLLVIDDAEEIDTSSSTVMSFIARRMTGTRIGVLAGARWGDSPVLRGALPELRIRPLDDLAAATLLDRTCPGLSRRVRRRILSAAQGNPLMLLELPHGLSAAQKAGYGPLPWPLQLTDRLRGVFSMRIGSLPILTRRLLLMLALDQTGNLAAFEREGGQAAQLAHLAPAEELGLVSVNFERTQVTFRSPLVRATVVDHSTWDERRVAHRGLADIFSGQPEQRAWHLAEAAGEPLEELAQGLEQAGLRMVRRGDVSAATSFLIRSAQMSGETCDRGRRLAQAAAIEAGIGGEREVAFRLLADAHRADPGTAGTLEEAVTRAHLLMAGDGDVDLAVYELAKAIGTTPDGVDDNNEVLSALQMLATLCWLGDDLELWAAFDQSVDMAPASSTEELRLFQVCFADPSRASQQDLDRLATAIARLEAELDPRRIIRVALSSLHLDRGARCRTALRRVVESGRTGEAIVPAIDALMILGLDAFQAGQWEQAGGLVDEGLILSSSYGHGVVSWCGWYTAAMIAGASGREDDMNELVGELRTWASARGARSAGTYATHADAFAALGRRDFETAYIQAARVSSPGQLAPHVPLSLWACLDLVEAAVRTGRTEEAALHVAAIEQRDIASLSPRLALLAGAASALVASDESAVPLFEAALAIPGIERWPFDVARVRLLLGERLRRARYCTGARTHLSAALETFERLGALPWSTRAAKELRATGLPGTRTGGPDKVELTAQEHEIALLAAAGLTNKEIGERLFLSHRTVGAHLYRIFPKLGITSRAALRDALEDRGERA
jgi:DNA-binding CsgD family transcriptional regulator